MLQEQHEEQEEHEDTCFMDLVWAAEPTRDTDRPTLIAGRIPGIMMFKRFYQ